MAAIELLCREFAAQSAQLILSGRLSSEDEAALDSTAHIAESIEERLIQEGMLPGDRADLRLRFIEELLRLLLNQANALFNYPHSGELLESELLPVWLKLFADLERPLALRDAFFAYYRQAKFFPYPSQIDGLLPRNACQSPNLGFKERKEEKRTPGYGREICERVRENCRIIRFSDYKHGRLPLPMEAMEPASGADEF